MEEEYLDVYALKEYLEKPKLERFLKDRQNFFDMALLTSMEVMKFFAFVQQLKPNFIFSSICALMPYLRLLKKWNILDFDCVDYEIANALRETSVYKECFGLYKEYIKDLAAFIKQFSFSNPKEIFLYFDFLFQHGLLSYNMQNNYYTYKNEIEYMEELLGARVLSGTSVCRHKASLVADVFKELRYDAIVLLCTFTTNDILNELFLFPKLNHAVVGVMHENKKIIYDPQNSLILGNTQIQNGKKISNSYIAQDPCDDNEQVLFLAYNQISYNQNRGVDIDFISQAPLERFTKKDLSCLREQMEELLAINQIQYILEEGDAIQFFDKNKKKCEEIARLEKELHPYSDGPVLEYKVRR